MGESGLSESVGKGRLSYDRSDDGLTDQDSGFVLNDFDRSVLRVSSRDVSSVD